MNPTQPLKSILVLGNKASPRLNQSVPGRRFTCPSCAWPRLLVLAALLLGKCLLASDAVPPGPAPSGAGLPRLFPDYTGVTLPPNIAPLNFRIDERGSRYRVELRSTKGDPIVLSGRSSSIQFPPKAWHSLLRANPGEPLLLDVTVQSAPSVWTHFQTITNHIAHEEIDSHLSYRLLKPLFNLYVNVGIYQRNLETFEQQPVLENQHFGGGCLNCHTPLNRQPDTFAFNIRGQAKEQPMMLVVSNQIARVDKTMGYLSWHPSGRLLTFSANKLSMFFHTQGETRDVYDARSDLGIYRVDSNSVAFPPSISLPDRNETWPAWSADGRHLYYSSAAPFPADKFRRIRYDLMRVSYDIATDLWGQPEIVVSSQQTSLSACQPKISPDGRFLLFTMCSHGSFPIYQTNSDLYLMDLSTRQYRRLSINSDQAESWHSWSSNSRWFVFSTKRIDGLFARPHFAYVDEHGDVRKPFVLPQQDPAFYDSCLKTFNVPELMQGPVTVKERDLAKALLKPERLLTPRGASPASPSAEPADHSIDQGKPAYQPIRE